MGTFEDLLYGRSWTEDPNKIAGALLALRENRSLCDTLVKSNVLTPLTHWHPEGPIFGFDDND